MATLWIAEFSGVAAVGSSVTQAPIVPPVAQQAVTFTTSVASAEFSANTQLVRIVADAACHIVFGGGTPSATTGSAIRLAAGAAEFFAIPGRGLKVAAILAA
jgi:hypothetical protein